MVSDDKFQKLEKRVQELEEQYRRLSMQIANMSFKDDLNRSMPIEGNKVGSKDTSKYIFKGKTYNKRNLVYATIVEIIDKEKIKKIDELYKLIPNSLQGTTLGVIQKAENISNYKGADDRYFLKDEQLITLGKDKYAVCKQWSKDNINKYIDHMNKLKMNIKVVNKEDK